MPAPADSSDADRDRLAATRANDVAATLGVSSTLGVRSTLGVTGVGSAARAAGLRRWRGRIIWLVLLAAVAGGIAWWQLRPAPKVDYRTDVATFTTLRAAITATGTLQPEDKVTVGAEVSGRVDEILVDFNTPVRKGQVLARLNTDELAARAVQARAGVAQAAANLAKAEHDLRRFTELVGRGFVSREQLDQARTSLDLARASRDSARAIADQAEANLAKAAIRSPIDGVVLDRKVERGQTVASSFQTPELFVIASDLTRLELTVDIDEADIGGVRVGQPATFVVDAYSNRTFAAHLAELRNAARTVANVVTYQGVLVVDNREGLLKPGMTATADIQVRQVANVLSVPNRALRFSPAAANAGAGPGAGAAKADEDDQLPPGSGRVWTVGPDGTPVPRVVQLGVSDGKRTQVTGGNLRAGERVIVDVAEPGAGRPRGMRVRL